MEKLYRPKYFPQFNQWFHILNVSKQPSNSWMHWNPPNDEWCGSLTALTPKQVGPTPTPRQTAPPHTPSSRTRFQTGPLGQIPYGWPMRVRHPIWPVSQGSSSPQMTAIISGPHHNRSSQAPLLIRRFTWLSCLCGRCESDEIDAQFAASRRCFLHPESPVPSSGPRSKAQINHWGNNVVSSDHLNPF